MEYFKDKVWLLKIPKSVYEEILKEKEIGIIDIIPNTNKTKQPNIFCHLTNNYTAKNFKINFEDSKNYYYFKEKSKPSQLKKINYFGRFLAQNEDVSDNIMKDLIEKEEKKISYTENYSINKLEDVLGVRNNKKINKDKKKEEKVKRIRRNEDEIKKEIFDMFDKTPYLNSKNIAKYLEQPDTFIKEILGEICDYINHGSNKGMYMLKSIYKKKDDYLNMINNENDDKQLNKDENNNNDIKYNNDDNESSSEN
jgi:hypothetical protein